ncbi:MAG: hypothetical protein JWP97_2870 [Labilithrix sp.]|nr:hypothetical protein [Labilithrix sp.]
MATLAGLRAKVAKAESLEEAAGLVARTLHGEYPDVTALARVYAVLPYSEVDDETRAFVDGLAKNAGQTENVGPATPVLVLLGTHGQRREWQDRRASKGHRGIPLVSPAFVQGIPMVAQLLKEIGVELSWLDRSGGLDARRLLGQNGVFYVADAADARDSQGRLVIPAQDFVAAERVRTVFGMGGTYADGTLVVIIVFTREALNRMQVDRLTPLVSLLKSETERVVTTRRFFAR